MSEGDDTPGAMDTVAADAQDDAVLGPGKGQQVVGKWFRQPHRSIQSWLARHAPIGSTDCDELAQEVFLRLRSPKGRADAENPASTLFRVAANVAGEWQLRRLACRPQADASLDDLQIELEEEPGKVLADANDALLLQQLVSRLPPRMRTVLLLHVNERLSYLQIARCAGVTEGVVARDLSQAYAFLRDETRRGSL